MKKYKYWLLTIAYCLLPIAFALSLSLFVRRLPDIGQSRENTQVWVYSGHPVSQSFTPHNDGLNVVTVYLKNVTLRNQDPFKFELSDSSGIIREINLSGYNIGDGDNVRFQFDPIPDSANRPFTFTFTSDSPSEIAIGVGFSEPAGSVAYQTYYFPSSRLQVLKHTATAFLKNLANIRFIITFVSLLLCIILLPRTISARFV